MWHVYQFVIQYVPSMAEKYFENFFKVWETMAINQTVLSVCKFSCQVLLRKMFLSYNIVRLVLLKCCVVASVTCATLDIKFLFAISSLIRNHLYLAKAKNIFKSVFVHR